MGQGDIEEEVYDELWLMSKFIMRFHVQVTGLGLGLGVWKVLWLERVMVTFSILF